MGRYITVFEHRCDEPFREFNDGCCGTIRTIDAGGDKYIVGLYEGDFLENITENNCIVLGDLFEKNGYGSAAGRVYDIKGVAPCLGAAHFSQIKYIVVKG